MVEPGRVLETLKGFAEHHAEKGRVRPRNDTHGFEPARAGRFQMQPHSRVSADCGVDAEFIAPRMDGDLVAAVAPGDGAMHFELPCELGRVADVVDSLLELPDKSGGKRVDGNTAPTQLARNEKVMRGKRRSGSLVDTDLQVVPVAAFLLQMPVHIPGKVQCAAVHQRAPLGLRRRECDRGP